MTEITDQDIKDRAKQIGDAPAFPVMAPKYSTLRQINDGKPILRHPPIGMTYRQWLYGQIMNGALSGNVDIEVDEIVQKTLMQLALEQLESEAGNG